MLRYLRNHRRKSQEEGFTLLELIVVLSILGIVGAIATPTILNHRKSQVDIDAMHSMDAVAGWLNTEGKSKDTVKTNVSLKNASQNNFTGLKKGTVLTLNMAAKGSWCLSAYNPAGQTNIDQSTALQRDSHTGFVATAEQATSTCNTGLSTVSETYVVSSENRQLVPLHLDATPNACGSIELTDNEKIRSSKTDFVAQGNNMQGSFELVGHFTLNKSCTAVEFNVRVKNADPTATYNLNPVIKLSNGVAGSQAGYTGIQIKGTESIQGSFPTTLTPGHNYNRITLSGFYMNGMEPTWVVAS